MDLIKIGITLKPYGVKGELKVAIEEAYLELFPDLSVIFIDLNGTNVPYFTEYFNSNAALLKLEEVDTPETAKKISTKPLLARREDIPFDPEKIEQEALIFTYLKQYTVVDKQQGVIGVILDVLEFPQQEMALLEIKKQEVLIPLNDSYITRIDKSTKQLFMDLPDGLIDLHTKTL